MSSCARNILTIHSYYLAALIFTYFYALIIFCILTVILFRIKVTYTYTFIYLYINFFWVLSFYVQVVYLLIHLSGVFISMLLLMMFKLIQNILFDLRCLHSDIYFYFSGFVKFLTAPSLFFGRIKILITQLNDRRRYILKKYVYTINHKRIAMNYFFFSM